MERSLPLLVKRILPDIRLGKTVLVVAHANSLRGDNFVFFYFNIYIFIFIYMHIYVYVYKYEYKRVRCFIILILQHIIAKI